MLKTKEEVIQDLKDIADFCNSTKCEDCPFCDKSFHCKFTYNLNTTPTWWGIEALENFDDVY